MALKTESQRTGAAMAERYCSGFLLSVFQLLSGEGEPTGRADSLCLPSRGLLPGKIKEEASRVSKRLVSGFSGILRFVSHTSGVCW